MSQPHLLPEESSAPAANAIGGPGTLLSEQMRTRWFRDEVQPHESAVRAYLQRRYPSIDADDVIQESYLKLLRTKAVGKIASAKAYFFSIARNTACTIFRRDRIYSDTPINEQEHERIPDEGASAVDSVYTRQRLELVITAIDALPARCGEVLRLTVMEGYSSERIARELGIAESTVRVQLVRGIQRCHEFIRQRGEG